MITSFIKKKFSIGMNYQGFTYDSMGRAAGEILVGQHSLFSAGNFVIGCPASLPTGGFAHVSSGITAETFLKRTAVARANEAALRRMSSSIVALADHEGFPAHGNAIRRRFN